MSGQWAFDAYLLTASGGPFRTTPADELVSVTPDAACAHPNWRMGRKISVDSATMMNKGLEVIEAHWLFGAAIDAIEVVIHPQSVIHSLVEYVDGSVLAQLGNPDMRTPIAQALAWPERIDAGVVPLDLARIGTLDFATPDADRFPCLGLAYCGSAGRWDRHRGPQCRQRSCGGGVPRGAHRVSGHRGGVRTNAGKRCPRPCAVPR